MCSSDLAEFLEDQNAVFPWKDIDLCVNYDSKIDVGLQKFHNYSIGVDVAKYEDFTVICVFDITEKPFRLEYFERFNKMPWQHIVNRVNILCDLYQTNNCLVDRTGVGDVVLEQMPKAKGFLFTANSKMDLINHLAGLIINHEIVFPLIPELIDELKYFQWIKSDSGNIRLESGKGFHDDIVMALALGCYINKHKAVDWNAFGGF